MRRLALLTLAVLATACRTDEANTSPEAPAASAETFAGAWRSVTPSFEFVRLSVASLSSRQGALGAHLTLSGVAWDGIGYIAGDSIVAEMRDAGTGVRTAVIVMRARAPETLGVRLEAGTVTELAFVREARP